MFTPYHVIGSALFLRVRLSARVDCEIDEKDAIFPPLTTHASNARVFLSFIIVRASSSRMVNRDQHRQRRLNSRVIDDRRN